MHALIRSLVAALLALWLAMPSVGGEGGENGGGTGVWVLPSSSYLSGDPLATVMVGAPRATQSFPTLSQSVTLRGSSECGQIVATMIDPVSCVPMALPVIGRTATVPATVLQGLRAAGIQNAQIVMIDAAQQGYVIHVFLDLAIGTVTFSLY
jgi:hypothetical protein